MGCQGGKRAPGACCFPQNGPAALRIVGTQGHLPFFSFPAWLIDILDRNGLARAFCPIGSQKCYPPIHHINAHLFFPNVLSQHISELGLSSLQTFFDHCSLGFFIHSVPLHSPITLPTPATSQKSPRLFLDMQGCRAPMNLLMPLDRMRTPRGPSLLAHSQHPLAVEPVASRVLLDLVPSLIFLSFPASPR